MSKVNLSSVIFYRGDEDHRPVESQLELKGIESYFKSIRFPVKGPTFLYGHRNNAVPYLLQLAGEQGKEAVVVEVHVEIGNWMRQKVDLTDDAEFGISQTRFLSVKRAKRDLSALISKEWVRHVLPEADPDWPKNSTRNPWILDHVIELPEFKHLAVIAYQVETAEAGSFQCATVFDLDAISMIVGGWRLQDIDVVL
jgi:hypothetical protein